MQPSPTLTIQFPHVWGMSELTLWLLLLVPQEPSSPAWICPGVLGSCGWECLLATPEGRNLKTLSTFSQQQPPPPPQSAFHTQPPPTTILKTRKLESSRGQRWKWKKKYTGSRHTLKVKALTKGQEGRQEAASKPRAVNTKCGHNTPWDLQNLRTGISLAWSKNKIMTFQLGGQGRQRSTPWILPRVLVWRWKRVESTTESLQLLKQARRKVRRIKSHKQL